MTLVRVCWGGGCLSWGWLCTASMCVGSGIKSNQYKEGRCTWLPRGTLPSLAALYPYPGSTPPHLAIQ
jgi:hypothetical protein